MSHPSRVCGLKLFLPPVLRLLTFVTPFAGVWIETFPFSGIPALNKVTPFAGVWIETIDGKTNQFNGPCHTLRGCVD